MKLATQDKPFFPASLPEKFRTVRSLGFDGFEIDGSVLVSGIIENEKNKTPFLDVIRRYMTLQKPNKIKEM